MGRGLIEPWHIILLVVVVAILFGWKKLPDMSRSVGRSMRIFKSEVSEMKNDGKDAKPSAAASDTVQGDVVPSQTPPAQPAAPAAPQPAAAPPPSAQPAPQPQATQPAPQPQATQPAPAYQPTPASNGQSAQDAAAEQQRHENPAL